jgi:hypothetical protein
MTIDLPALLAKRPWVPERTLIDCLDLLIWLGPALAQGAYPRMTTAKLMDRWYCSQPTVSRRVQALRSHELLDATDHPGAHAYWIIYGLGPA